MSLVQGKDDLSTRLFTMLIQERQTVFCFVKHHQNSTKTTNCLIPTFLLSSGQSSCMQMTPSGLHNVQCTCAVERGVNVVHPCLQFVELPPTHLQIWSIVMSLEGQPKSNSCCASSTYMCCHATTRRDYVANTGNPTILCALQWAPFPLRVGTCHNAIREFIKLRQVTF